MKKIIIKITMLLAVVYANGQQAFTNSGNLQIYTGGSFAGFGDFSNNGAAALVNNGALYIKGSITNNQVSMSPGTGTLFLDGTATQSIAGSQVMRTYHLNTNNTAGILLNNNLSVNGIHTFADGLIASSATPNYLVYEAGASYAGTNDSRHVTGWVKKMGNTNFDFPVGDASYLRTISVTSLSAVAEFNCHYYRPSHHLSNVSLPVRMIKSNEYWQLDKVSGGTGQVTLNWDHSKVPMDNVMIPDIITAYYNGTNWTDEGGTASGNVMTTGTTTSNIISSFGSFTIGYKMYPVPLTLISFTGERKPGTSYLRWITDNEQNVDHFDIQRSYDAASFTTIGSRQARNTGIQENYLFEDQSPLSGFAWYRLRTVDFDGKTNYSRIILLSEMVTPTGAFVVISPIREAISILNRTGKAGKFNYRLLNTAGQQVIKGNVEMMINGGAVLPLPPSIAGGMYVLYLNNETTRFTQRILVQKPL